MSHIPPVVRGQDDYVGSVRSGRGRAGGTAPNMGSRVTVPANDMSTITNDFHVITETIQSVNINTEPVNRIIRRMAVLNVLHSVFCILCSVATVGASSSAPHSNSALFV